MRDTVTLYSARLNRVGRQSVHAEKRLCATRHGLPIAVCVRSGSNTYKRAYAEETRNPYDASILKKFAWLKNSRNG